MFNKLLNGLFKAVSVAIAICLALMILLTFANVVGRFIFNVGFVQSEEMARLCFIFLVYLGSIEAMKDNRHILIDTFLLKFPPLPQKIVYALTQVIIIFIMIILSQGAFGLVLQNLKNQWVVTGFPSWIVHLFGLILGVSVALIALLNLVKLVVLKQSVVSLIQVVDNTKVKEAQE